MGLFDNVASIISAGASSAERNIAAARTQKELDALAESKRDLLAQLGESMLRTVKRDPLLREQHQELLDTLDKLEAQQATLRANLTSFEQQAAQEQAANMVYECPKCYRRVLGSQQFCPGCGTPISVIIDAMQEADAAISGKEIPKCFNCGAQMAEGDAFCSQCGTKQ